MRVAISQRVENVTSYKERRDCLDQRWAEFASCLGATLFPLANMAIDNLDATLEVIQPDLVILTGGNSISMLDETASDAAPERDEFEMALLGKAIKSNFPVLGVCRGMQLINLFFGGKLRKVENHIAVRHKLLTLDSTVKFDADVNSFHGWGMNESDLADMLQPLAQVSDGSVEALRHSTHNIFGIMWHPEREDVFSQNDINLIKGVVQS